MLYSLAEDKKKIVWTHLGDNIGEDAFSRKIDNIIRCFEFSHRGGKSEIELLMKNASPEGNFKGEFKRIVELCAMLDNRELLIALFPLDIDMQALNMLVRMGEEDRALQYLKQMLAEAERSHYLTLFGNVEQLVGKVTDIQTKGCLEGLIGKSDKAPCFTGYSNSWMGLS